MTPEEREYVMKVLHDPNKINALYDADYWERPVSIDEFLENPDYLGWATENGKNIYPYWRERMREIFDESKDFSEVALTGSIGSGKSHIAVLCLCYSLYKLMCLKDPGSYYNLSKGSPIYIVFLNLTITLSEGVAFSKFNNILLGSPWFMRHGKQSASLKKPEYIPDGNIRFTAGSQTSHVIGKDIAFALLDELNFGRGSAAASMEKSQIMNLYNNVVERIRSRFIVDGRCKGKVFLVSSKKAESDFLESYIRKQKDNENVKVCDAVLWKVKPSGTYSGKKFKVAFAGTNMPPKIIREDKGETESDYIRMGYNIEEVPIEFKGSFELDILAALNNVCGIVISDVTKFMTYDNLSKCYNPNIKNPFRQEIITVGCKDKQQLRDFYDPTIVPEEISSMPLFIHMDCSINGDRTGISCIAVLGFKYENRYDIVSNTSTPTKELCFRHVFSVGLQAPNGDEISFQKSREFLYYLKFELGYNIKAVSTDGFQSYDLRQQLTAMGFNDVSLVSLDRKPDGYLCVRNAINEKRVMMLPDTPALEHELINLERDNQTGKIDHTPENSKDISDSLAGAIFNANEHLEDFTFATAEVFNDALTQNVEDSQLSQDREMLLASLVTPLSQVRSDNMTPEQKKNSKQSFYDFSDMEDSMLIF